MQAKQIKWVAIEGLISQWVAIKTRDLNIKKLAQPQVTPHLEPQPLAANSFASSGASKLVDKKEEILDKRTNEAGRSPLQFSVAVNDGNSSTRSDTTDMGAKAHLGGKAEAVDASIEADIRHKKERTKATEHKAEERLDGKLHKATAYEKVQVTETYKENGTVSEVKMSGNVTVAFSKEVPFHGRSEAKVHTVSVVEIFEDFAKLPDITPVWKIKGLAPNRIVRFRDTEVEKISQKQHVDKRIVDVSEKSSSEQKQVEEKRSKKKKQKKLNSEQASTQSSSITTPSSQSAHPEEVQSKSAAPQKKRKATFMAEETYVGGSIKDSVAGILHADDSVLADSKKTQNAKLLMQALEREGGENEVTFMAKGARVKKDVSDSGAFIYDFGGTSPASTSSTISTTQMINDQRKRERALLGSQVKSTQSNDENQEEETNSDSYISDNSENSEDDAGKKFEAQ